MVAKTSAGVRVILSPSPWTSGLCRGTVICCGSRTAVVSSGTLVIAGKGSVAAGVAFGSVVDSVAVEDSG